MDYNNLFFLRLAVGIIFIYHAIPKLRNSKEMSAGMGFQPNQVFGLGLVEFVSGLCLIGGLALKLASFLLMTVMAGAIYHKTKKWSIPFSANNSTGWEFDMLLLAASLSIYINV